MLNYIKRFLIILFINFIDQSIANFAYDFLIILPLTFLAYSFYVYKSDKNIGGIEAFSAGLFIDLISDSYFGLNAIIFCLITYVINLYANAFKLFSYLQVCLFFGFSSTAYIGFTQLVINLYDFSYLTLFISSISNVIFCILIAIIPAYFPKNIRMRI
jgi:rod shape-determining protein MreD